MVSLSRTDKFFAAWTVLLFASMMPNQAFARGIFKTLPDLIDKEWVDSSILSSTYLKGPDGFALSQSHSERHGGLDAFLRQHDLHPSIHLTAKPSELDLADGGLGAILKVKDYNLRVGRYEICKSGVRTVDGPRGSVHAMGVIPHVGSVTQFFDDDWVPVDQAIELAADSLKSASLMQGEYSVNFASKCLYVKDEALQAAWFVGIRSGSGAFHFYIGHEGVLEGDRATFDGSAPVTAYASNATTNDTKTTAITVDVDSSGYLTNEYFTTSWGTTTSRKKAPFNDTNPKGDGFREQSVFAHVNQQLAFVLKYGYVWSGPKPVVIRISYGRSGNAQFSPPSEGGPSIIIGADNQGGLENLATDSDVVSHEFGHQVVYSAITQIASGSESLILHEGLADAMAFLKSEDSCLAESICPATNSNRQCWEVTATRRCLRTAEANLTYKDPSYINAPYHQKGQVISGFFWHMYKNKTVPLEDLRRLLVLSISYLPNRADFKAFLTAVLDADFAIFNKAYQSAILDAANAKGMSLDILQVSLVAIDGVPDGDEESSSSSKSRGFLGLCSIGSEAASSGSAAVLVLILLFPLAIQLVRQPKPVAVKIKKNRIS